MGVRVRSEVRRGLGLQAGHKPGTDTCLGPRKIKLQKKKSHLFVYRLYKLKNAVQKQKLIYYILKTAV